MTAVTGQGTALLPVTTAPVPVALSLCGPNATPQNGNRGREETW